MDEYTVEVLCDNQRGFSFNAYTSPNSLLVDPTCIPGERIVKLLDKGHVLKLKLDEHEQNLSMTYIAPDSTKLFLLELGNILNELSQQGHIASFPSVGQRWYYILSSGMGHRACSFLNAAMHAKRIQSQHKIRTKNDKVRYIAQRLNYQVNMPEKDVNQLFLGLARLDLLHILNPKLNIPSRLQEDQQLTVMALGNVTFHADELLPYALQDKLYLSWRTSRQYNQWIATHFGDFSDQFRLSRMGDRLTLNVPLHPQWRQREDGGIDLNLDYRNVLDLYEVPYLVYSMDDRGNFYVGTDDQQLEVRWDIDLDIQCDDEIYQLHIPLLETDSLDMMMGTPVRFRDYFLYSGLSNVTYPVNLILRSPMETMFVLDRLATMLTSGMVIQDVSLEINDGEGGKVERRYTQPWVLASLITQLLFQQKPPKTLNECAYRLLRMARIWHGMKEHPWGKVTIDGYRDELAIASLGNPPLLARSHGSLQEYITERVALMHASGWFETEDRQHVGLKR